MARVQHNCTGCVPIDASIIEVYTQLISTESRAEEAAERAEHAAEHAIGKSPYIGENGDWWEWNDEQAAFIDTGVQAQGQVAVDIEMSTTSTNPVQNRVVTAAVNEKYTKPATGIPATDIAEGVIPDVSQFITASVNNLVNYYLKSETYNKTEVDSLISAVSQFSYEVVATLPTASASTMYKIYLVPSARPETQNVKDEYITIRSGSVGSYTYAWEQIGSTAIDLSGYVTTQQLNTALSAYTTTANLTTLLAAKQDVIADLATIRSGAASGATAYQKPSGGIPKSDLASGVQGSLDLADSAIQARPQGEITPVITPADYATREELGELEAKVDNNTGYIGRSVRSFVQGSAKTHFWDLENAIPANKKWSFTLDIASGIVNQFRLYFKYEGDADYTMINQYCSPNTEYHYQETRAIVGVQIYVTPSNAIGTGDGNMVVSVYDSGQVASLTEHISKMVGGIIPDNKWEFGNITIDTNAPWVFSDSSSRVRTRNETRLSKGTIITHNDFTTFKLSIGYRDIYGGYVASGWKTQAFELPWDADVVILIATISGSAFGNVSDYTSGLSVVSPNSLSSLVSENFNEYNDRIVGQGEIVYYGKKRLQLSPNAQQFRCGFKNIYRETYGSGNPRQKAQSMAYSKDRIFVFESDNYCDVYVLSDMSNNKQRNALPFDISHWNNAQASTTYIGGNKHPLILLSRGDYAADNRSTDCYLIQVSEPTDYSYSFAIYKTIHNTIDESKWNGTWVADWQRKKLYLYTFERGGWDVMDNNDTIIFEFDLPDITSAEDVTLGYNDVKRIIHLPHFTMQGADIVDGKLFMAGENVKLINDGNIWTGYNGVYGDICVMQVIDLASGMVVNYIPTGNIENEGLFILDGKVYLMSHNGTTTVSTDIVFRIDEYDFLNSIDSFSAQRTITGTTDWGISVSVPKNSTFAVELVDNSGVYGDNSIPFYFNYGNGAVRVGDLKPNVMLNCRTSSEITEVRIYATSSKIVKSGGTISLQVRVLSELLDN